MKPPFAKKKKKSPIYQWNVATLFPRFYSITKLLSCKSLEWFSTSFPENCFDLNGRNKGLWYIFLTHLEKAFQLTTKYIVIAIWAILLIKEFSTYFFMWNWGENWNYFCTIFMSTYMFSLAMQRLTILAMTYSIQGIHRNDDSWCII